MSNHGQTISTRSRRSIQDQSGHRSPQRSQNFDSTQQRVWGAHYSNYSLEATSSSWFAFCIQWQRRCRAVRSTARRNRSTSFPTNWPIESRKRLPQKKITNQLASQRRGLIEAAHPQLSIRRQCQLLDLASSSYYYQPVGESAENLILMQRIDQLFTARPELGVRRMQQELNSVNQSVNVKRVRRLMRLMGLEAIYPKPKKFNLPEGHQIYPYLLRGIPIEASNQVWSTDITYVPMASGFLYLCVIMDWYSRFILSWRLSNTLLTDFCVDALKEALSRWGKPLIFNTDQGSQFTSKQFLDLLRDQNIQISMDGKGRALDNIFVERLWRTVKYEHLYLYAYADGLALYRGLKKYFQFYNYDRKHQSLSYQVPAQWYLGNTGKNAILIAE
jgi:putative transposase